MLGNLFGLLIIFTLTLLFAWLATRAWKSQRALVKWPGFLLCGLLALVLGLVTLITGKGLYTFYAPRRAPLPQVMVESAAGQVTRGEHIAQVVCLHCHASDDQLPLSGGTDIGRNSPIPIGSLVPFNLTPAGPIRDWSDAEIFRAIRYGVDRNGRLLLTMSSLSFRLLSDEDITAVIAYLRTQPAVEHTVRGGDRPNLLFAFFAGANLLPKSAPVSGVVVSPAKTPTAEYGEYIVGYLGCRDCHGPDLTGGKPGGFNPVGPSLAAAGMWSQEQFIQTIQTGVNPAGHALNPVKMFWKDFAHMDDDELASVHEYLRSLAAFQAQGQQ